MENENRPQAGPNGSMNWTELTREVSRRVWQIECADMMIEPEEADRWWDAMPPHGSNRRVEIERLVGCSLIILKDMGLVNYERHR
jgi:hypothetical protein